MAVLAFALVFVLGGGIGGTRASIGPSVNVVVAAHDIPMRATINANDITLKPLAQADVPPGALTRRDDAKGLVAEVNISQGQPVTQNLVAKSLDQVAGQQAAFLPIGEGFVAITIPTGEQQGVAGYVQPNDYITMIASVSTTVFPNTAPPARTVSKTVFTNVHVIRVGPFAGAVTPTNGQGQQASATGVSSSLTVVMNQCDAEYLNWLLNNTSLKYVLESYKDYASTPTRPDDSCPTITSARGVGPADVDRRFGFTQK
jgi:Flp pilus assembly protein CpaB